MVDVFDEVDQSLREDKKTRLWRRFGPFVWFLCFALIVGVGYNEFSTYQSEQRISKNVERFETALSQLEDGAYSDAQAILSDLIEGEAEIAPLAAQYLARSFYEGNGDAEGAALVKKRTPSAIQAQRGKCSGRKVIKGKGIILGFKY